VGGDGVARGYVENPDLTAERFIPDPHGTAPGSRLYRTGDIGRYRADGDIEFVGRNDSQVKLRGMRIELGEIESVLKQHERVREAVVTMEETEAGERRLVAFVVGEGDAPGGRELREFLKEKVPEYMAPAVWVAMSELPMTPSGKIDRKRLKAPERETDEIGEGYEEPATAVERVIAGIWEEVTGKKRVGARDNFFEIGGHSLMATQVMSRIREALRVEVGLRSLFEEPTVRGLARVIVERTDDTGRVEKTAEILLTLRDLSETEAADILEARRGGRDGRSE